MSNVLYGVKSIGDGGATTYTVMDATDRFAAVATAGLQLDLPADRWTYYVGRLVAEQTHNGTVYEVWQGSPTWPEQRVDARTTEDILYTISSRDPDGRATEPSDWQRDRFKKQVIDRYGQEMWDRYIGGSWMPDTWA